MKMRFVNWTGVVCIAFMLIACQAIQPTSATQADPGLSIYTDEEGFFTVAYPANWVARGSIFADAPFPHVAIGSHDEIMDLSLAEQPLPVDQIGVGLMLIPREMFAEVGLSAETPLADALPMLLVTMADDPAVMSGILGDATAEQLTLANGAPAVRMATDALTEAYVATLADLGDGLYLFASRIEALGHHNSALEAQVDTIVDSFALNASTEEVMTYIAAQMGEAAASAGAAPTITYTATEYRYDGPDSIPGGLTRIELVNAGTAEHMLWAVKLDEGRTFEDIMEVFATLESEPQFPAWMTWYGGISAAPGATSAYTVDLVPGTYSLFSFGEDAEGVPDAVKGMVKTLTVTETAAMDAVPPTADLRTQLVDFSFIIEGDVVAGQQTVEITNAGMEPHEMIVIKLAEGATMQEAVDFMMAGAEATGAPPFEFVGGAAPMAAGFTAWYEVDLPAGEYGVICFVPSPDNEGAPHFLLGMTRQFSVQ